MSMTVSRELSERTIPPWLGAVRGVVALTKPRVAVASVLTAVVGYATTPGGDGVARGLTLLVGASLAAGGTLAFNQWWEREADSKMARTRCRPLVRGVLTPGQALAWSTIFSVAGVALLALAFNAATALVAAATCVIYGFIYTPLKRTTRWATEVGALSGALPPLLGSAAADDLWSSPAVLLGAVLLLWQMPHFFAIGWIYRDDYRAAGFPLLPAADQNGRQTAAWSLGYSVLLAVMVAGAWAGGWAGFGVGLAGTMGAALLVWASWRFFRAQGSRDREARWLFRASLASLAALMAALLYG